MFTKDFECDALSCLWPIAVLCVLIVVQIDNQ